MRSVLTASLGILSNFHLSASSLQTAAFSIWYDLRSTVHVLPPWLAKYMTGRGRGIGRHPTECPRKNAQKFTSKREWQNTTLFPQHLTKCKEIQQRLRRVVQGKDTQPRRRSYQSLQAHHNYTHSISDCSVVSVTQSSTHNSHKRTQRRNSRFAVCLEQGEQKLSMLVSFFRSVSQSVDGSSKWAWPQWVWPRNGRGPKVGGASLVQAWAAALSKSTSDSW